MHYAKPPETETQPSRGQPCRDPDLAGAILLDSLPLRPVPWSSDAPASWTPGAFALLLFSAWSMFPCNLSLSLSL